MLPIDRVLPDLLAALDAHPAAVLVAPPGAGKTTAVPIALLAAAWRGDGRILVVEPRRIATRAAASRMAELLGEPVGRRVGYRVRMDARVSEATRIEVVTAGVFTRMLTADPELTGVAAVLLDEFHERGLEADLALALLLDTQGALRPDLRLLAMSATLDGARVARLLGDAPVIESAGRAYPVETRHMPRAAGGRIEEAVTEIARRLMASEPGSALAFLPGQGEIARTAERLAGQLPDDVDVIPLHGGLDGRAQDAAIRPAPAGRRKLVLATSIAETSITIDGVRLVIDSGLARRPAFDPGSGLTRLETVRVSRASADQRRGRAGRTEPGLCIRLWEEGQTAALSPFDRPEILDADLTGLVLDLAGWGVTDPAALLWLDPPPAPAWTEAVALARALEAIDERGHLTDEGTALRRLPLEPRLAHMIRRAAAEDQAGLAAELAVLLTERGLGGNDTDLRERLRRFRNDRGRRAEDGRALARRFVALADAETGDRDPQATGRVLAAAFPDRIAQARGRPGTFRLAAGRGGVLDVADALAREAFLVAADLQGGGADARILAAAPLSRADIDDLAGARIRTATELRFERAAGAVRARRVTRLEALVLAEETLPVPAGADTARALAEGIRSIGPTALPLDGAAGRLITRLGFLADVLGDPWPQMDMDTLLATLEDWLMPFLPGVDRLSAIRPEVVREALLARLPPDATRQLDRLAPDRLETPGGRTAPIDYGRADATASVRVQDLFGLTVHPSVADGRVPLVLELLSPADRPIQITRDLPGFWRGSWAAVRAELRGRYPKHAWPEDPASAPPVRLKSRLT